MYLSECFLKKRTIFVVGQYGGGGSFVFHTRPVCVPDWTWTDVKHPRPQSGNSPKWREKYTSVISCPFVHNTQKEKKGHFGVVEY